MKNEEDNNKKECDLELLPPKPRYVCENCKKAFKHLETCKDGKQRCKNCKKKIITNKFYNPNWKKKNNVISKFNVTNQEKRVLLSQNKSLSRINNDIRILNGMKRKSRYNRIKEQIENRQKEDLNKKLIEGLKNK